MNVPKPPRGYWAKVRRGQRIERPPLSPDSDPSRASVTIQATIKKERPKAVAIETAPLARPVALHPLVIRTQAALGRTTPTQEGLYSAFGSGILAIVAGEASCLRALHFMDALLKVLEQRGHKVESDTSLQSGRGTVVTLKNGERLSMRLRERLNRVSHVMTKDERRRFERDGWEPYTKYDFHPSGELHLEVGQAGYAAAAVDEVAQPISLSSAIKNRDAVAPGLGLERSSGDPCGRGRSGREALRSARWQSDERSSYRSAMMTPPTDRRTDEELVAACNSGSSDAATAAFEALYRRHRAYVLRIALRVTREPELAADVLQETFGYLLRLFPPTGRGLTLTARLTTFLYPIAKNFAISAARRARRLETGGDDRIEEIESPAPPDAHGRDAIDLALAGLSPERREVLVLRFVEDLSLAEIAAALEIPLGTVKSRLHLALQQLRQDSGIRDLFKP